MQIKCSKQVLLIIIGVHALVIIILIGLLIFAFVRKSKLNSEKTQVRAPAPYVNITKHVDKHSEFDNFLYLPNGKGHFESIDLVDSSIDLETKASLSDVTYYLYTQRNLHEPYLIENNDINGLNQSNFDSKKMIIFVSHGWTQDKENMNILLKPAIIENHDVNLFIIDWSKLSKLSYIRAKNAVRPVGEIVGNFINQIQSAYGLTGSPFVLIGNSLGAHVVGNAGAVVKSKVGHIVGLDPASPLFNIFNKKNRLDASDGMFVQVIHTSRLLGFISAIGHVDYYPNGGTRQPGCGLLDLTFFCSHRKAYNYYAESVEKGSVFLAHKCNTYGLYLFGICSKNAVSFMGQLKHDKTAKGTYYLQTNSESPYAIS